MNIIELQALRLIKERGMSVNDAVTIAIETQKKRGLIKNGELTEQGIAYGNLSSEDRAKVRKATDMGYDINKFDFTTGHPMYNE